LLGNYSNFIRCYDSEGKLSIVNAYIVPHLATNAYTKFEGNITARYRVIPHLQIHYSRTDTLTHTMIL